MKFVLLIWVRETSAAGWTFDYLNQGADWGEVAIPPPGNTDRNKCGDDFN